MQHTLSDPPLEPAEFETDPTFNVVIAYEDFDTGKHAKRVYDFLADTLGNECRLASQMWKFDVLGIPKLREIACGDAATADLVLIACHGDELPEHTKAWIESWLANPNTPLALVALLDEPSAAAPRIRAAREYLADAARRGGMEFFARADDVPGGTTAREDAVFPEMNNRNQRTLHALAGVVQQDLPAARWSAID